MSKSFAEIARHPARLAVIMALALLALVVGIMNASAVHDLGVFELDRNAIDSAAAGDDWNTLANGTKSAGDFTGIIADGSSATIFTTGGSKDDGNTTGWQCTSGSSPDKDDILHGFGAAYNVGTDHVVYFGLDRYDQSGSADLGLWFFQNPVKCDPATGSFGAAHQAPDATHPRGDILILVEFGNGGALAVAKIYEWVGSGGNVPPANTLNDLGVTGVDCAGASPGDDFCITANVANGISAPCEVAPNVPVVDANRNVLAGQSWSDYTPKNGRSNQSGNVFDCRPPNNGKSKFPPSSFFEGGINISAIFGSDVCFSSFLAETRSSPSVTAQLKDFVGGSLNTCPTPSTVVTEIHQGTSHTAVTVVEAGSTVHDKATVSPSASFNPTGTVTFKFYRGGDCTTGTPDATVPADTVALDASGVAHPSPSKGPLTVGSYAFRAHYNGDTRNLPADSPCEPLQVVDAQIDLSPLTATNAVNSAHTITCTIQQDDGLATGGDGVNGFGPAPNGTTCSLSLLNNTAGASFVSGSSCTTTSGSCTVQINTSTAGSVDIHATTTFSVGGLSVTRATGTGGLNSADANKRYVDAQIDLSPLTATNAVNSAHTITCTIQQDDGLATGGDGVNGFTAAPNGTTCTLSLLNNTAGATFVGGINSCTTTAGSCTVQINTSTAGSVDIHATTTFSVGGVSLTRATGTGGLNSADANKVYVNAAIGITPQTGTNPVGTTHTLTATVKIDPGTGLVNAPNGTCVVFSLTNTLGATATFVAPNDGNDCGGAAGNLDDCRTTAGTCTVTIQSNTVGHTEIAASTTVTVGGVSLTRDTDPATAPPSGPGGTDNADKDWTPVQPGIVTAQHLIPNDDATLSGGLNPTGSITFKLFAPTNTTCLDDATHDPALEQTVTVNGTGTYNTTNTTFVASAEGTWRWLVSYSGDANNLSATSACGIERFTIANS